MYIVLCLAFLNKAILSIKTCSWGSLLFWSYCMPCLCLQRYMEVTKNLGCNLLLVFSQISYLLVSQKHMHLCKLALLLAGLKTVHKDAGINTSISTPHSMRSASTSAAMSGRASLQEILSQADWSTFSTFHKHYFRPQPFSAFSLAVLKKASNLHVDRNWEPVEV